jgi:hypothetical protein
MPSSGRRSRRERVEVRPEPFVQGREPGELGLHPVGRVPHRHRPWGHECGNVLHVHGFEQPEAKDLGRLFVPAVLLDRLFQRPGRVRYLDPVRHRRFERRGRQRD